jgi:flagellar hook protein FlgE
MFTTLSTALSALNANSIAVSAVGNDLASLDTTGYKTTEVAFEDLMAETNHAIHSGQFANRPRGLERRYSRPGIFHGRRRKGQHALYP